MPSRPRAIASAAPALSLLALLVPALAEAHVGIGDGSGFGHGFTHPLGGLDHVCAMVGVGLWAAQRGGRAVFLIPALFVGVMALGGLVATNGLAVPLVEQGIAVSVLAIGALVAAAARLPLAASAAIVGLFALLHGHAHGAEMPANASGLAYGSGFLLATVLLHALGLGIALAARRAGADRAVRVSGGLIAVCGVLLLFTV